MAEIYLHGDLELHIIEARGLPNMKLHHRRECITSYIYVTVSVPQARVARTRVLSNSQNPKWDEHFHIPLAHPVEFLNIRIKNKDVFRSDTVGRVHIPAQRIASGDQISGWFPIDGFNQLKPDSALRLWMVFMPCEKNPLYGHGIAGDPLHRGVRNTYFPPRNGSSVTLYQDAHVTKMPAIELGDGSTREHAKCWEDICHAIAEAKHLVYVVGWSVFHKIKLTREPTRPLPRGGDLTLGELLKYKSREGVRVLLLVWDDKTAYDSFFLKRDGVMKTHCKETKKFFQHSSVMCILASRHPSSKHQVAVHLFTHHQKCVLVDTQAHGNNRKITAFLGGLDLCDGRYDTPEHRLFHDLETVFKDDFHQPSFPATEKAPRQPWHDLHCRIEGPAAYDVLMNFAQRWQKITEWSEFSLVQKNPSRWKDDAMIDIERMSEILSPAFRLSKDGAHIAVPKDDPKLYISRQKDPENWHVQVFRSIDSGSLRGFPTHYKEAEKQNLVCAKDLVIDKSIQTAYIQAIRSAQHFIYIENQYFLGSSYAWPSYHNAGVDHLIPMELALKIASKIRAKERFVVYVVIPMWPEGDPKHNVVQEILFWQGQTMEMMYQIIANEIKSMQLDSHPQDFLNFFCLGNREPIASTSAQAPGDAQEISDSYKFQRFMVYVHAKGMVVDDEYVIIGSANMNERSMAGTRDSEIAMGAYQPHHCWAKKKQHPRGQVYGYRMSLWAEHLGAVENYFDEPESLDCVRSVNSIAEDNWKRYTCDEFTELQGHLLKYPLSVDADGNVSPLPGHENFPDVGGSVLGAPRSYIPDILTT